MTPVTANPGEYRPTVGLDSLHIALVTADTAAAYTADTPEYFAPAAQASQAPVSNQEIYYADNTAFDTIDSEGETVVQVTVPGLPLEMYAKVLGKVFDPVSGRIFDNHGKPPDVAFSYRSLKSDGVSYRYYQFLKGRFSVPNEEAATRSATPDPKDTRLTFRGFHTIHKFDLGGVTAPIKRIVGDDDTNNFNGGTWFAQVQTPGTSAPAALALSTSDPLDNAAAVVVTKTLTLTFSNALSVGGEKGVTLVKADGTVIASAITLDVTRKIVTVDPTANLTAASTFIVTYAVKDIYGQTLNGALNFATA